MSDGSTLETPSGSAYGIDVARGRAYHRSHIRVTKDSATASN
jgi:hypothetical protein